MSDANNAGGVPAIEFGGRQYMGPFQGLLPTQTPEKLDELRSSVQAHGILQPILHNQDDVIIDGLTRLHIAIELGISPDKVPFKSVNAEYAQAEELAISMNYTRRQMSSADRVALVKKLRSHAWSMERIAKALNVGKTTVVYDLKGRPAPKDPSAKQNSRSGDDAALDGDPTVSDGPKAAPSSGPGPVPGNGENDWGGAEPDNGPNIPDDDMEADARKGVKAVGQLVRACLACKMLTDVRHNFMQKLLDDFNAIIKPTEGKSAA